jgi:hypothetical protein
MTDRPDLLDIVDAALDHGIRSVDGGGTLIPFVIHEEGGDWTLHRFVAVTLEEGVDRAREFAWHSGPTTTRIALTYDGYLTVDGVRRDAIFVQVQAAGTTTSDLFAQQYEHRDGTVVEVGNAKHVAIAEPPLLAGSAAQASTAPPAGTATPAPMPAPKYSLLGRLRRR